MSILNSSVEGYTVTFPNRYRLVKTHLRRFQFFVLSATSILSIVFISDYPTSVARNFGDLPPTVWALEQLPGLAGGPTLCLRDRRESGQECCRFGVRSAFKKAEW